MAAKILTSCLAVSPRSVQRKLCALSSKEHVDLHRYRANATQRMRFLPYWQDLTQQDRDGDNELQAMRSGIPAYSTWIADEPNLSNVTALHSLRGKNVLLMGCSYV